MHNDISIIFKILPINTLQECGPHSNLNFVEFLGNHLALLNIKMYAIVPIPTDNLPPPCILYMKHHRAASDVWMMNSLCDPCLQEFLSLIYPITDECNFEPSCSCNICLHQPPSLRGLASHVVSICIYSTFK
jgi:hypothetical protein